MFAHDQLNVYRKALQFVAAASGFVAQWDRKHAVTDQLARASDSLVVNLAEAARLRPPPSKLRVLDYALGSCLECAACLDIARIKGLLSSAESDQQKQRLSEIIKMLVGLRKTWAKWQIQEEGSAYKAEAPLGSTLFHHERLEVYGASLEVMEWFVRMPAANHLPNRLQRQLDEALTGIALNIAEGNGRYSDLDHHRFLDLAAGSAVKAAAYLDLAVQKDVLGENDCQAAKGLLERILAMLSRM